MWYWRNAPTQSKFDILNHYETLFPDDFDIIFVQKLAQELPKNVFIMKIKEKFIFSLEAADQFS